MKIVHVYDGIYYAWVKTPVSPGLNSIILGMLNFISWGVSL